MAMKSKLMMMSKIKAKKKPEHKAAVEGDAPRQRLDRPSRVRRADGGPAISEDSKREVERLRDRGDKNAMIAGAKGVAAGYLVNKLGRAMGQSKPFSRMIGTAAGIAGMGADERTSKAAKDIAESNRIERGEAEPGKEDRKKGGRVCK